MEGISRIQSQPISQSCIEMDTDTPLSDAAHKPNPFGVPETQTSFFTQKEVSRKTTLPLMTAMMTLPDGNTVKNHSGDKSFYKTMEQMSLAEADGIRQNIQNYPDSYPMPGMASTAEKIREGIEIIKLYPLTAEDQAVIGRLQSDLEKLEQKKPAYPYRESLAISYRFLHYKSLIEFKFTLGAFDKARQHSFGESCGCVSKKTCVDVSKNPFRDNKIAKESVYSAPCTLRDIEMLPWHSMLSDTEIFKDQLSKHYDSIALHREKVSGFIALGSGYPLIPCTDELDITFFCKTAGLPLWLAGFSLEEYTSADGVDMGASEFFEHDLFHLAIKLDRRKKENWYDLKEANSVLQWIKHIYEYKEFIGSVNFEALELVIFLLTHEQSHLIANYPKVLKKYYQGSETLELNDLPEKYKNVTINDVRTAAYWLSEISPPGKDVDPVDFKKQIEEADRKTMASTSIEVLKRNRIYHTYQPENSVSAKLKKLIMLHRRELEKAGLNPARIKLFLNYYKQKRTGYREDIEYFNDIIISNIAADKFKKEAKFIKSVVKGTGDLNLNFIFACQQMEGRSPEFKS